MGDNAIASVHTFAYFHYIFLTDLWPWPLACVLLKTNEAYQVPPVSMTVGGLRAFKMFVTVVATDH